MKTNFVADHVVLSVFLMFLAGFIIYSIAFYFHEEKPIKCVVIKDEKNKDN